MVALRTEILHPSDYFRLIHGQFHSYAWIDVSGAARIVTEETGAARCWFFFVYNVAFIRILIHQHQQLCWTGKHTCYDVCFCACHAHKLAPSLYQINYISWLFSFSQSLFLVTQHAARAVSTKSNGFFYQLSFFLFMNGTHWDIFWRKLNNALVCKHIKMLTTSPSFRILSFHFFLLFFHISFISGTNDFAFRVTRRNSSFMSFSVVNANSIFARIVYRILSTISFSTLQQITFRAVA